MSLHIATTIPKSGALASDYISQLGQASSGLRATDVAAPAAGLPLAPALPQTDVLVQLRSNLAQLEELHSRLRFVMSEISYLIKR